MSLRFWHLKLEITISLPLSNNPHQLFSMQSVTSPTPCLFFPPKKHNAEAPAYTSR